MIWTSSSSAASAPSIRVAAISASVVRARIAISLRRSRVSSESGTSRTLVLMSSPPDSPSSDHGHSSNSQSGGGNLVPQGGRWSVQALDDEAPPLGKTLLTAVQGEPLTLFRSLQASLPPSNSPPNSNHLLSRRAHPE